MTPIDCAIRPLLNYANWTGRATRAEFWWFTLFSTILGIVFMPLIGAFWLLYYYVSGGTSGSNRFGDDPYYDPYREHRYA